MKNFLLPGKGKCLQALLPVWLKGSYILQKCLGPLSYQTLDDIPGQDLDKCHLVRHC